MDYAEEHHGVKLVADTKLVLNMLTIFLPLPLFWAMYGQINSRWVFQASKMDGELSFYTIKPDQMVMSCTISMLFLIPFFERVVFPALSRVGINKPLQKVLIGFFLGQIAFMFAAIVEWNIGEERISMLWLLPQYLTIATAEIFVWVSILSFAYTQAPADMKSVITAFIYLTIAGGSLIVVAISSVNFLNSQLYEYLFYVAMMSVNTIWFWMMMKSYKYVEKK